MKLLDRIAIKLGYSKPKPKPKRQPKPKAVAPRHMDLSMARMYAAAKQSRLTQGWGVSTTSEDHELQQSLQRMRDRSREACRDSSYAKRAKVIVQNNVVGAGIGFQGRIATTRGDLNARVNEAVETAWETWSEAGNCHTGKSLHFCEFERQLIGQIFESGEIFVRKHYQKQGQSLVPLALEIIESERIADLLKGYPTVGRPMTRLGIELDLFQAPIAYWIYNVHPYELRFSPDQTVLQERIPGDQIYHLRLIDRWPQTRGVPWMHAALRRINDMDGLGEAEIVAARAAACYMGFIQLPNADTQYGTKQPDGTTLNELSPALIERLNPGETFSFAAPNRPNAQLDPFMRLMLREVASGVGASYESLSRDYSQSNYSSSRLALLDDRDLWRQLQRWFIRSFRTPLYREWLTLAVMAGAIPEIDPLAYAYAPEKFQTCRFKPRGWNWVDPEKEVAAYKEAIRCGFTTVSRVIEQTGNGDDLEDILEERIEELAYMRENGLIFDTDPLMNLKGDMQGASGNTGAPIPSGASGNMPGASPSSGFPAGTDSAEYAGLYQSNGHHRILIP
jgi:lambda family phage portal protein